VRPRWPRDDDRGSGDSDAGGHKITGDYSRHAFSYVVPAGESAAGTMIAMILLNEETVELDPGGGAEHEIWRRCEVIS
jgi:hypothetical protein